MQSGNNRLFTSRAAVIYGRLMSRLLGNKKIRSLYFRLIRKSVLHLLGYRIVNPYWDHSWTTFPPVKMKSALDDIMQRLGVKTFNTIIDFGCGQDSHYTAVLRNYGHKVIGVDIIDKQLVTNLDDYIQVSPNVQGAYFGSIQANSIDCVFVIGLVGIAPSSNFETHIIDSTSRAGRYLTKDNLPRIIKPGGYLVWLEWEALPERRLGKAGYKQIASNIRNYYPSSEIANMEVALQGFSREYKGPYIVYRKV